jgi:hypothetical protein
MVELEMNESVRIALSLTCVGIHVYIRRQSRARLSVTCTFRDDCPSVGRQLCILENVLIRIIIPSTEDCLHASGPLRSSRHACQPLCLMRCRDIVMGWLGYDRVSYPASASVASGNTPWDIAFQTAPAIWAKGFLVCFAAQSLRCKIEGLR